MALGTKSTTKTPATAVESVKNVDNIIHFMAELTDIRECANPELRVVEDDIAYYKSTSGSLYLWAECTREDGLSQSAMLFKNVLFDKNGNQRYEVGSVVPIDAVVTANSAKEDSLLWKVAPPGVAPKVSLDKLSSDSKWVNAVRAGNIKPYVPPGLKLK